MRRGTRLRNNDALTRMEPWPYEQREEEGPKQAYTALRGRLFRDTDRESAVKRAACSSMPHNNSTGGEERDKQDTARRQGRQHFWVGRHTERVNGDVDRVGWHVLPYLAAACTAGRSGGRPASSTQHWNARKVSPCHQKKSLARIQTLSLSQTDLTTRVGVLKDGQAPVVLERAPTACKRAGVLLCCRV